MSLYRHVLRAAVPFSLAMLFGCGNPVTIPPDAIVLPDVGGDTPITPPDMVVTADPVVTTDPVVTPDADMVTPPPDLPPAGCPGATPTGVQLVEVTRNLDRPLYAVSPPGDNTRMLVVEQTGFVVLLKNGVREATPFLDLRTASGGDFLGPMPATQNYDERGLLGLAFHPNFASNGRIFINYTEGGGDVVLAEMTATPDQADASSLTPLITVEHSENFNHNGGQVAFGPDGYLYWSIGDGGAGYDPYGAGQDLGTLLGKIHRIDVDSSGGGKAYGIPSDNPFVGTAGAREEIWAYGLRNPWRFHHDTVGGNFYIGDVGQDVTEEIDVAPIGSGGLNYGWSCREGGDELNSDQCPADQSALIAPAVTYEQTGGRCSVTGGYVYNNCTVPELNGRYVYSDYCSSEILSFLYAGGQATDLQNHTDLALSGGVSSFGLDAAGELYVITYGDGVLYRFEPK